MIIIVRYSTVLSGKEGKLLQTFP